MPETADCTDTGASAAWLYLDSSKHLPAVLYFNNKMPSFLYRATCNPDEFYSTWCWQAYFIAIWALLEVWIYRKVVDPNWQIPGHMSSGHIPEGSEGEQASLTAP